MSGPIRTGRRLRAENVRGAPIPSTGSGQALAFPHRGGMDQNVQQDGSTSGAIRIVRGRRGQRKDDSVSDAVRTPRAIGKARSAYQGTWHDSAGPARQGACEGPPLGRPEGRAGHIEGGRAVSVPGGQGRAGGQGTPADVRRRQPGDSRRPIRRLDRCVPGLWPAAFNRGGGGDEPSRDRRGHAPSDDSSGLCSGGWAGACGCGADCPAAGRGRGIDGRPPGRRGLAPLRGRAVGVSPPAARGVPGDGSQRTR